VRASYFALAAVGAVEPEILSELEICLRDAYGFPVRRLAPLPEPEYAYDAERRQYSSILVLGELAARCPESAVKLLAVTEKDLFIPILTFIYGQAQLGGTLGIISLARLRQEFYGLPPNREILLARAKKEALHEAGHMFNLTHCGDRGCVMCLATNLRQLDLKNDRYCEACAALVRETIENMHAEKSR
jgi:archaemetzincin